MSEFDEDDVDPRELEPDEEMLEEAMDSGDEIDPLADDAPGAEPWAKTSSGDVDEL